MCLDLFRQSNPPSTAPIIHSLNINIIMLEHEACSNEKDSTKVSHLQYSHIYCKSAYKGCLKHRLTTSRSSRLGAVESQLH